MKRRRRKPEAASGRPSEEAPEPAAARTPRVGLLAFAVTALLLAATCDERFSGLITDGQQMLSTAGSMVFFGELGISRDFVVAVARSGGDAISRYGLATSLIDTVAVFAARLLHWTVPGASSAPIFALVPCLLLAVTAGSIASALQRLGLRPWHAVAAGGATILGTPLWAYSASELSEPVGAASIALLSLAVIALRTRDDAAARWEVLAGAAAGTALLTKSILLLPALPLLLAASLVARREARPVRAGARPAIGGIPLRPRVLMIGALLGALWALFELTRFGTLGGGYAGEGFTTPFGTGFRGLTILPNKGILFYAPIFFLVPFGFVALQRRDRPLALALCLSPLLFLFAISTWWAWDGQIGWGPRLLLPALPPLLLLAALGAHHLGRTGWLAFGSLLLAGAAVNLPGVLAPYSAVEMAVASDPPARHLALAPSWWPPRIAFDYLGARWKGGDVASRLATEAFAGIEPPAVSAFAGKASNLKVYFWPSLVGNPAFEVDEVLPALVLPFRWPFLGRSWLDPSFSMSDPWRLVVRDQAIRALDTGRPERTLTLANLLLERGDRPPDPRDVALRAEAYRLEGRIPEARAEASRLADACHPMLLWPRALTGASLDCVPPLSRQGIRASIERSGRAGWTLPGWLRSFRAATRERPYGGP